MQTFKVGELFQPGVTRYPEQAKFDVDDGGAVLLVYMSKLKDFEIENVRAGKIEFGLFVEDEALFITCKFWKMARIDAPYSIHLSKKPTSMHPIGDGLGLALTVYLIDADTGILKVIRLIGLGTSFSRKLKEAIGEQIQRPFNKSAYFNKINAIMQKYSSDQLYARSVETFTADRL